MSQQEVSTGIGLRRVRVALRDTDGVIKVPAGTTVGTAYQGLRISGALAMTITIPDPQRVVARGDDRTYYTFQLPPTEGPTGELRVSKTSTDIIELLTGTIQFGSPPVRKVGLATDAQGNEPAIVLWGSQQAIDSEEGSEYFGQQIWRTYMLFNALAALRPATMEDAVVGEFVYSLASNDAPVDELGTAFALVTHGFTKAPFALIVTKGKFGLDAFLGDGTQTTFTLSHVPSVAGVTIVAVDGVVKQETTDWSEANGVITFVTEPADGAKILVEYEYD